VCGCIEVAESSRTAIKPHISNMPTVIYIFGSSSHLLVILLQRSFVQGVVVVVAVGAISTDINRTGYIFRVNFLFKLCNTEMELSE
jgi:hypothetical protein